MSDQPIGLHRGGPPETVLPADPADVRAALEAAKVESDVEARREQLRAVARAQPSCVTAWAYLGDVANQYGSCAYARKHDLSDLFFRLNAPNALNQILLTAGNHKSRRRVSIRVLQRGFDIGKADVV